MEPFNYKPVKAALDAHLPHARLRLFCFDRTTGNQIGAVGVLVGERVEVVIGRRRSGGGGGATGS